MIKKIKNIAILGSFLIWATGCVDASIFPNIPLTLDPLVLANPIAMAASANSNRLYIVNSNNRVNYFDASFVILDITNPVFPVGIAAISIANFSGQIILDEARGLVYLPNRQSSSDIDDVDNVLVININEASPGFLTVQEFPSGNSPFGAFWDGTFFFTAAVAQALQYNVNDFSGFTQVDLGVVTNEGRELEAEDTREIAIAPSDQTVWVTNRLDNMLILNRNEWVAPVAPGGGG
ncbi:MAG: hypothetical protein R3257_00380, partial [bacterium]|nr:hypothetical protein [bacterium]